MNEETIATVLNRFDVSVDSDDDIALAFAELFGSQLDLGNIGDYFRSRLNQIVTDLQNSSPVFLTYIYHVILGNLLTNSEISSEQSSIILDYIRTVQDGDSGFLPVRRDYVQQFPQLGRSPDNPMVPEVYSTYYGFWVQRLLGQSHSNEEIDSVLTWIIACQQTSGLIYNPRYSNTNEERRFESEKTGQLFFGSDLMIYLQELLADATMIIDYDSASGWIRNNFLGMRTITGRYYAYKSLGRISPDEIGLFGSRELLGFINDRYSLDDGGYLDYRLEDKRDESMSSRSYTSEDVNTPHVFSTYYALSLIKSLSQSTGISPQFDRESIRNFAVSSRNTDGGFGHHILIKAFPTPFGPDTTDLETLLVLLLPSLVLD